MAKVRSGVSDTLNLVLGVSNGKGGLIGEARRRASDARNPRTDRVARRGSRRRRVSWSRAARRQELRPGGDGLGVPLVGLGVGVGRPERVQQQGDRGGSVGHGVVHLGHDSEPIVGQSLDHDDLPQGPVPGQWPAGHVGHHRRPARGHLPARRPGGG